MRTRSKSMLLACAVAVTIVATAALAAAGSPLAHAQSGPSGSTGDSGATACPASNPANELVLVGGTPQTALLESAFASPLQVAFANSDGCPVTTTLTGTAVTFTAPVGGASVTFAASGSNTLTVGADGSGNASVQMLAANDTPGTYTVTASSSYGSVSFALTNSAAGIAATITALGPVREHATVNHGYPRRLAVRVLDANGTPVLGATVTFNLATGAGSGAAGGGSGAVAGASFDDATTQATVQTNADGVASSPGLRANATSGRFTATASVAHVTEPARFRLRNIAAGPDTITTVGSSVASVATARVGTRYPGRLQVRVRSATGRPVAGATVTFTLAAAAATGASGGGGAGASFTGGSTQATATTGAGGVASSPRLTANNLAGGFTATASATAISRIVVFRLRNDPGPPATITAGVGASQTTTTATRFAIPLAVTVSDAHANKTPAVAVTFTAPASGPAGSFPGGQTRVTVKTNSSGIAVAPAFTANSVQGGYIVTATVNGVRPVAFALVNQAP